MVSLAHQRPPLPAIAAVTTATGGGGRARQIVAVRRRPCHPAAALTVLSTSVLQPWRPLPISIHRPPSPAIVAAAAATDGGGHARQIVAVHRHPRRPAAALAVLSASYCGHGIPIFLPLFQLELETLAEESLQTKEKAEKVYFYLPGGPSERFPLFGNNLVSKVMTKTVRVSGKSIRGI